MTDPREIAQALMRKAQNDVSPDQRGRQHGDLAESFGMIADLWNVYLRHKARAAGIKDTLIVPVDAVDVLEMMSLLKKARNVYGAPLVDHAADDIGYTGLAGGLRLQGATDKALQDEVQKMTQVVEQDKGEEPQTPPIPAFLRDAKTEA